MTKKLWDGPFQAGKYGHAPGQPLQCLRSHFDRRLYTLRHCRGALPTAEMLAAQSAIITGRRSPLESAGGPWSTVQRELDHGEISCSMTDYEDIHMGMVEKACCRWQKIGCPRRKDPHRDGAATIKIALDVRMALRERCDPGVTIELIARYPEKVPLCSSRKKIWISIMPGYTHLQRAQPVLLAHHLMAYQEMLTRDFRIGWSKQPRTGRHVMPLGSRSPGRLHLS